jgi:hypothetical protein
LIPATHPFFRSCDCLLRSEQVLDNISICSLSLAPARPVLDLRDGVVPSEINILPFVHESSSETRLACLQIESSADVL